MLKIEENGSTLDVTEIRNQYCMKTLLTLNTSENILLQS